MSAQDLSPQPDADLLVAGAGAAGLFGALVAAHHGASVLLLERDLDGPSNLLVSGGLFPGAGTRFQRDAGITDSPELFAQDVTTKADGKVDAPVLVAIAAQTAPTVHFLADTLGLPIKLLGELVAPGHAVARMHGTPKESGRELHQMLRAAARAHPRITLMADTEVTALIAQGSPARVTGLHVREARSTRALHAPAVLLATGGFASNAELLAEYIPDMKRALHIGAGANDGCAIVWARSLGADVAFMPGYQGQGHVNPPAGRTRLGMALPPKGAFMVNREGRRFISEDIGPSELAAYVLAQPGGVALEVFDARIHEFASRQGPYREACEAGHVKSADTPEALARLFGVPEAAFTATFAAFRQAASEGRDPEQGRKQFGPPLESPLYGAWVTGALAHTQGGLRVDACARVVRTDASVIEGLYAAGGAAASISGTGGAGYLPGNGLGQSFGLAMLAGQHLIGSLTGKRA